MDFESPESRRPTVRVVPSGREEIRASRVRDARARIAAGYYDRVEVREKLVDAVIEELNRR